jgi:hypothetical protein
MFTDMIGGAFLGGMYTFYDGVVGQVPDDASFFISTTHSVPPFDPDGQAIDPDDPPTGWYSYNQFFFETSDGSSLELEYARLEIFYMGPIDWQSPAIPPLS